MLVFQFSKPGKMHPATTRYPVKGMAGKWRSDQLIYVSLPPGVLLVRIHGDLLQALLNQENNHQHVL
jgi:hypothetical protein